MKVTFSIPDELVEKFNKACGLIPRSTMIQKLMQEVVDQESIPESAYTAPVTNYATRVIPPLPCEYCGWTDETPKVTYISTVDDVRKFGKLCARCLAKAKQANRYIGEGNQVNG